MSARSWRKQLFEFATAVIPAMEIHPATDLHVVAVSPPPVEHNQFLRMPKLPEFPQTLREHCGMLETQLATRRLRSQRLLLPASGLVWRARVSLPGSVPSR